MLFFFFFLIIRRPPRSTLFPTRRSSDLLRRRDHGAVPVRRDAAERAAGGHRVRRARASASRSEEHTSELQSRVDLVCRLLLEKKKKTKNYATIKECIGSQCRFAICRMYQ